MTPFHFQVETDIILTKALEKFECFSCMQCGVESQQRAVLLPSWINTLMPQDPAEGLLHQESSFNSICCCNGVGSVT